MGMKNAQFFHTIIIHNMTFEVLVSFFIHWKILLLLLVCFIIIIIIIIIIISW